MSTESSFYMLGKPLTIVDAINRRAAATGSMNYAIAAGSADYNGHPLSLTWNDYRGYYVLEYYWGERVVLHRGKDFAEALRAAKSELARQGRGATLSIVPLESDLAIAREDADLTEGDLHTLPYPYHPAPDAWKFKLISEASVFHLEHALINAATESDYETTKAERLGRSNGSAAVTCQNHSAPPINKAPVSVGTDAAPSPVTLFYRDHRPFTGKPQLDDGRPSVTERHRCGRCGGAGGSEKWRHTGWTCYDCGGSGLNGTQTHKLYTADQLARLDKAANTRAEKKAAKAQEAQEAAKREADARRERFNGLYGALFDKARPYAERSEFVRDVIRRATERAELSEAQELALRIAIDRFVASDARKAASGYVGAIGERIELTVTAERIASFEGLYGTTHIVSMRDQHGNAIVSKGRFVPPTADWNRDHERWNIDVEPFTLRATVKEHSTYRDEKQTVVQRATTK